jgi:hypothetical protein
MWVVGDLRAEDVSQVVVVGGARAVEGRVGTKAASRTAVQQA